MAVAIVRRCLGIWCTWPSATGRDWNSSFTAGRYIVRIATRNSRHAMIAACMSNLLFSPSTTSASIQTKKPTGYDPWATALQNS